MSWVWNNFRDIGDVSKSISKKFLIMPCRPSPTLTPTPPRMPLLTPSISLHPNHESTTDFPPIILDYTFSPTTSPTDLLTHWHDLYRSRDLWFSHSKSKTKVVILAVFHPATPNDPTRFHGRLDIWRHANKKTRLTDEIILFPSPHNPLSTNVGEKVTFSLQEIFGENCDFRFHESGISEDMEFVLDVNKLRREMRAYRCDTWPYDETARARMANMFL
ncbi:hypothetical protein TWF481_006753 [Arthrobotrys musiformis]|uniref:Uncharacterized protein n=1 Tax=Arthrobotrys musiformis TaxID=47236 RepID=A0AAV9WAF2_9PEZI